MNTEYSPVLKRVLAVIVVFTLLLFLCMCLGVSIGSTGNDFKSIISLLLGHSNVGPTRATIIWQIRLPRTILAVLVGATLALGGLIFQTLLRNPLAEPYILGISGGSAVGAIIAILIGLSQLPGIACFSFVGSMGTLFLIILIASRHSVQKENSLLLAGVMVNALCSSIIIFLVSVTQDSRIHSIIFWLMGELSVSFTIRQAIILSATLLPCYVVIFFFARPLNLLLMGQEAAMSMGVNTKVVSFICLIVTSLMVSAVVSQSGLVGFVGLVIPHVLRIILGSDHRILLPSCILGGGAYMVLCDLLARVLPSQGEMPVGVITAMIGAPLFILLLQRSNQ